MLGRGTASSVLAGGEVDLEAAGVGAAFLATFVSVVFFLVVFFLAAFFLTVFFFTARFDFFRTGFFFAFFLAALFFDLAEDLREGLLFRADGFFRVRAFFFGDDFFDLFFFNFLEVFFFLAVEAFATLFSRSGKSLIVGVSGSRTPPLSDR